MDPTMMNSFDYDASRYAQLLWIEKYKPRNLNDLMLEDSIRDRIIKFTKNKSIPNLILTGPSGVGKTCSVHCIAKELYGPYISSAVIELNASDGGIKLVYEDIDNFCKTKIHIREEDKSKYANFKLIIMDEADQLIDRVQPRIHSMMETYKNVAKFIFICNTSYNIIEAIQTECFILRYTRLSKILISKKIIEISNAESIQYQQDAVDRLAELSCGDMRNAINMLHLIYHRYKSLNVNTLENICDAPQHILIKKMLLYLIQNDLLYAFQMLDELKNKGYSGSDIMLGVIYTLKSQDSGISEDIKIEMLKCICVSSYKISKGFDSMIQLCGCLCDIMKAINPIIKHY